MRLSEGKVGYIWVGKGVGRGLTHSLYIGVSMIKIYCGLPGRLTKEVRAADCVMEKDYKEWELKDVMAVSEAYLSLRAMYGRLKKAGMVEYVRREKRERRK